MAYLVTVNSDGSPHVVSIEVLWDDDGLLSASVGRRSAANAHRSRAVTLLWPAPPGDPYGLIVDGDAANRISDGDGAPTTLAVTPRTAVLHRTPLGDPTAPSCIRVLERS